MRSRAASKAWPRWAAAAATTTARSPISRQPDAVHRRHRGHRVPFDHRTDHVPEPVERGRVRGVVEVRHRLRVVVVAHRPDEERHAPAASSDTAASTSATSSGVSRISTSRTRLSSHPDLDPQTLAPTAAVTAGWDG